MSVSGNEFLVDPDDVSPDWGVFNTPGDGGRRELSPLSKPCLCGRGRGGLECGCFDEEKGGDLRCGLSAICRRCGLGLDLNENKTQRVKSCFFLKNYQDMK